MNSKEMLGAFFKGKTIYRQTSFYIEQRKKWKILIGKDGKPIDGKWTFDEQNRVKYPKTKSAPKINRSVFQKNPRLNMLIKNFDKMPVEKQNAYLSSAEEFLVTL